MKKVIGLKFLILLHLILSAGLLWYFIFLIPVVYDSSAPISFLKISVAVNLVLNLVSFIGLTKNSKYGWYSSVIFFSGIAILRIYNCIAYSAIQWLDIAIILLTVCVLLYLLNARVTDYFGLNYKFKTKWPEFKDVKVYIYNSKIVLGIIVLIHVAIVIYNILKHFDKFGYVIGNKQIPAMYDKFWLSIITLFSIVFILSNLIASVGILAKKNWALYISLTCFSYLVSDFIYQNLIFKLLIGYEILELLFNFLEGLVLVLGLMLFAYFVNCFKNKSRKGNVLILASTIIGISFIAIDVVRLSIVK